MGGPCFDPWSDDDDLMKSCESDEELLGNCIAHTRAFSTWATEVDFQSTARAATTTPDGSGSAAWISRLQGMNIAIANHGTGMKWTLDDKLCSLARQGKTFTLDWHQGKGKYNANACTSMICNQCRAKEVIFHPGLPSKGGNKADPNLIDEVNQKIVKFFSQKGRSLKTIYWPLRPDAQLSVIGQEVSWPPTSSNSCGPEIEIKSFV